VRLALATLAAALALVPAASAATVAKRAPQAGPALAGSQVAWGERWRDGTLWIVRGAPRSAAAAVPAPTTARTARSFPRRPSAFAASADAFAAVVDTGTSHPSGDAIGVAVVPGVLGGAWPEPGLLAGDIPPSGDAPCTDGSSIPEAVDADGPRVAIAERIVRCGGDDTLQVRIVGPDGERVVPVGSGHMRLTNVELAGRYVAWSWTDGRQGAVMMVDLDRDGAAVVFTSTGLLRAVQVEDLALDDDGTLALTYSGRNGMARLGIARPGRHVRVLASDVAGRGIAISGGWILYEQRRRGDRSELRLRHVSGARPRRLAGFGPGHRRVGDLDLGQDGSRATWAVGGRAARIVVRSL
jgi:hypothetical protein